MPTKNSWGKKFLQKKTAVKILKTNNKNHEVVVKMVGMVGTQFNILF